jgi:mRNA-degrading endonuclease RelE of RelBE toxin-antitoxin system
VRIHTYEELLSRDKTSLQAVSISDSYRITLTVMITKKEIILLDIGTHDEVTSSMVRLF